MKKITVLMLIFLLSVTLVPVGAFAGSTTPQPPKDPAGSWAEGPPPNRVDPAKPALLFVHGLNSSAEVWTKNDNDMLQRARDAGYQTATINLYDTTGTSQDMWDNGKLLADKIKVISNHFGKSLSSSPTAKVEWILKPLSYITEPLLMYNVSSPSAVLIMVHNLQISPTVAGPDGWQISSGHKIPVPPLYKHLI